VAGDDEQLGQRPAVGVAREDPVRGQQPDAGDLVVGDVLGRSDAADDLELVVVGRQEPFVLEVVDMPCSPSVAKWPPSAMPSGP
jgi:hypothetical protein